MGYILFFCRAIFAFVFSWSFLGKIHSPNAFVRSIQNFRLLPKSFTKPLAWLFMFGELVVVIAMIIGRDFLVWGFILGTLLLMIFSLALALVLASKIKTSCNCFGASEKLISPYDLVRNIGFISCGIVGVFLQSIANNDLALIDLLSKIFMSLVAIVFVLIFTQLEDIVSLFK
jgi:hypothetical protein